MLVIVWERAWANMAPLAAEESLRAFNVATLANPYADQNSRDTILAEWERVAAPRQGAVAGSLKRFKNWAVRSAMELFGVSANG